MLYNQMRDQRIFVMGVCSGLGQTQLGLETGPQCLREHGICEILSSGGVEVVDIGNIRPEENEKTDSVWSLIERVRSKAFHSLQNKNFLFTMGGDHSISIGTVQATLMTYPKARVIWIDAHGDINTPQTSLTGNLHGMPLAALLGLFKTPIDGPQLSAKKLLVVGVRDLDPAEQMFFDELNIEFISAKEIRLEPLMAFEKINSWLKKDSENPIHVSFDIDSLDPSIAPATGLRVPLGLSVEFSKNMLNLISATRQIVSIDLVELNPFKAENPQQLGLTIESIKSVFASISVT